MNWKYEYLVEQLHRTAYKKHEAFIVGNLFNDPELQDLKPITQYYARRTDSGYALLDLYYPQLNIAIEIDESHHEKNVENDLKKIVDFKDFNNFKEITTNNLNYYEKI